MAMLRFKDLSNLKTKRIVFEDVFKAGNCAITLGLLKDLTAKRRLIEELVNRTGSVTEAVPGGLGCQRDQVLHKLEGYLPLLESLVHHAKSNSFEPRLKIRWTSVLSKSCTLSTNANPMFYQMDGLQYERAMALFLYGSTLRERALKEPLDLADSVTLLRQAAGVFEHLACYILPLLPPSTPQSKPAEVVPCVSDALSLVCLAEAQAVGVMRAQQRGTTSGLLAKLNMGVAKLFDQASAALTVTAECREAFPEFVSCSRGLYELRGYGHFAESLKEAGEFGNAIGLEPRSEQG